MGKIVAYTGTHGVGKTTAAFAMAAELKKTCPGEVGMVQELARECPLPIYGQSTVGSRQSAEGGFQPLPVNREPYTVNRSTTREGQLWLFAAQIRAELEAVSRYDVVVCDRTAVDAIAYTSVSGYNDLAFGMLALVRPHVALYERVIFLGATPGEDARDDGFRNTDQALRMEVQCRLLELYRELGIRLERKAQLPERCSDI